MRDFNSVRVSRIFDSSSRICHWTSTIDLNAAFYMCRIELKLCLIYISSNGNLKHVTPAQQFSWILFGKTMLCLDQMNQMYSFDWTKMTIWFGACKMRRLNQALRTYQNGIRHCGLREWVIPLIKCVWCCWNSSMPAHRIHFKNS